jgi:hypothetical protein
LYNQFKEAFPNRVPVKLADGIERFNLFQDSQGMTTLRVHTEVKVKNSNDKHDIVILEDREQTIYPKGGKKIGGFEPPFLVGLEVKVGHGNRSDRISNGMSGGKVVEDIVKLTCCGDAFSHCFVVFVDLCEKRNLIRLREVVKRQSKTALFYAGLDKFELILP